MVACKTAGAAKLGSLGLCGSGPILPLGGLHAAVHLLNTMGTRMELPRHHPAGVGRLLSSMRTMISFAVPEGLGEEPT